MATRQHSLDIVQEPPPPYEPLDANSPTLPSGTAAAHAVTATATPSVSATRPLNPFLGPEESAGEDTGGANSTNSEVVRPPLPPRTSVVTTSAPSSPTSNSVFTSTSIALVSTSPSQHADDSSAQSSPPATSLSPSMSTTSSQYRPPMGPPPLRTTASSSSTSRSRPQHDYRPTTAPTPGQPLLRKGKLLIYPTNWPGCPKCADTGYKQGDPSNPCKKCWDKYGKVYTPAVLYSVGLNDASSHLQKPLPSRGHMRPARPPAAPHPSSNHSLGSNVSQGQQIFPPPSHPHSANYVPPPPRPPRSPTTVDAETEGGRMTDVPPNYHDASNVPQDERLPSQYVPPAMPPPGPVPPGPPPNHYSQGRPPPPPIPQHGYHGGHPHFNGPPHTFNPYSPPAGPAFAGGFSPYAGGPNPHIAVGYYGMRAPPGALVVMPGDPRIGGQLCYECGGRGEIESWFFGDETCRRCRGSGRVF